MASLRRPLVDTYGSRAGRTQPAASALVLTRAGPSVAHRATFAYVCVSTCPEQHSGASTLCNAQSREPKCAAARPTQPTASETHALPLRLPAARQGVGPMVSSPLRSDHAARSPPRAQAPQSKLWTADVMSGTGGRLVAAECVDAAAMLTNCRACAVYVNASKCEYRSLP